MEKEEKVKEVAEKYFSNNIDGLDDVNIETRERNGKLKYVYDFVTTDDSIKELAIILEHTEDCRDDLLDKDLTEDEKDMLLSIINKLEQECLKLIEHKVNERAEDLKMGEYKD